MKTYQEMCDRLAAASKENAALLAVPEGAVATILSDEDRTLSDTLEAEIETLGAQIKEYEADQIRRDRQRAREAELASSTRLISTTPATPATQQADPPNAAATTRISRPRTYGRLKGFTGPNAVENAYRSGQFLLAVCGNDRAKLWCREHGVSLSPQAEDSNQMGGFLVPPEFDTAIIDLREEYGVFRRESKVVPMASDTRTVPRRKTGLTAYYIGENSTATESNKTWNQVQLVARKLGCLSKYSSELDEDAIIDMASDLAGEMAYAFAKEEDEAGFIGDGTATYGGISGLITECTTATATTVSAVAGNLAFSSIDLTDFESMVGKLPQYAENGAKWYISKAGWAASMLRLIDAAGGNTGAMIAGMAPKEFLGYPVVVSQVMNSTLTDQTTTYGLAYLGNLALASTFGNRRGVTVKVSDQRYLEYDQIGILGTERYDIKVHDVGDTSVAGAMIMLATPGA